MKIELSDRFLRSPTKPETGRLEVSDTKRRGLRFRLTATGRATWVFEKRVKGGPKRKHSLGSWPAVSLSDARKAALEIEAESSRGIDRVANAEVQRLEAERAEAAKVTISQVLDKYFDLHLVTLRRGSERKRQLEQAMCNMLASPIGDLQTRHLQAAVDEHIQRGKLVLANRVRAALRAFTAWAWQRGYLAEDVGQRVAKGAKESARERVLAIEEVQAIYAACNDLGQLWGPLFKLLVLTGQRRNEIVALRWEEIDFAGTRIVKPGSATKNGKDHITHLAPEALAVLASLKPVENSPFVFTTTGATPVSGVSKAKARLDNLLREDFESWRIHDLRTAMATALAESGEAESVVDRMLNHSAVGSAPSAVSRVYQRGDLLPQRARAMEKWTDMVTGADSKVIRLNG